MDAMKKDIESNPDLVDKSYEQLQEQRRAQQEFVTARAQDAAQRRGVGHADDDAMSTAATTAAAVQQSAKLIEGTSWYTGQAEGGQTYYYNSETQASQWDRPDSLPKEEENDKKEEEEEEDVATTAPPSVKAEGSCSPDPGSEKVKQISSWGLSSLLLFL